MSVVMTAPDYSSDPYRDLTRRIIEARVGYERLCGFPPTVIHVNGPLRLALLKQGFKEGGDIAGMTIISSPESIADMAICSRDQDLFKQFPAKQASEPGDFDTAKMRVKMHYGVGPLA